MQKFLLQCALVVLAAGVSTFAEPRGLMDSSGEGGGDVEAPTGTVTASFMGNSGGMKLYQDDSTAFVMIQQAKLEEVGADGKKCSKCTSINVAGQNSWSALQEETENGQVTAYKTTFTVSEKGVDLSLLVHLAKTDTTTQDIVPCSGCLNGTAGECMAQGDAACSALGSLSSCPANTTACTEDVTVGTNQLKFSIVVQGFSFKDSANKLSYGITLKSKTGGSEGNATQDGNMTKVAVNGGFIEMPGTALIKGGAEDKEVNVTITTGQKGQAFEIAYLFDSFEDAESLYYDPTLGLITSDIGGPDGIPDDDAASSSARAMPAVLVILGAALALA